MLLQMSCPRCHSSQHWYLDSTRSGPMAPGLSLRKSHTEDGCTDSELFRSIANALETNSVVTGLDLGNNKILDEGCRAFSRTLSLNRVLAELHLGWNSIGVDGAQALVEGLSQNTALTTLDLGWNALGVEGGKAVARHLAENMVL